MFGIYIHIPFCLRKCDYCDFYSEPIGREPPPHVDYLRAVLAQLDADAPLFAGRRVASVYFGGGTPSLMPPAFFKSVLAAVAGRFAVEDGAEISCEVNPATADLGWFRCARSAGVTRISIGVQSFQERLLKGLGRAHTAGDAMRAIAEAQDSGFGSVGLDLMYGIPGEGVPDLEDDLRVAMTFQPQHVSAYALTIEEGTPLQKRLSGLGTRDSGLGIRVAALPSSESRIPYPEALPCDDEQLRQMRVAARMLGRGGWRRYEISNFAREGFECRHNLDCWRYGEYLGLGAGAASFFKSGSGIRDPGSEKDEEGFPGSGSRVPGYGFARRWIQSRDVRAYMAGGAETEAAEDEPIDRRTAMAEYCFLGLRKAEGISIADFEAAFGVEFEKAFPSAAARLAEEGLAERRGGRLRLTGRGIELSSTVSESFLP
ncbi:MAG: radical SAM family heme chaperone HemW [Proteobacteria bacterium]|nr:radical SAM family heme chaperone HemW [Pseudomonadota bacterium]